MTGEHRRFLPTGDMPQVSDRTGLNADVAQNHERATGPSDPDEGTRPLDAEPMCEPPSALSPDIGSVSDRTKYERSRSVFARKPRRTTTWRAWRATSTRARIHASPPCQAFTAYRRKGHGVGDGYGDLIAQTRELLNATGLPWVMENVEGAPLRSPLMLCGSMFDPPLDVRRHRYFETDFPLDDPPWPCRHKLWAPRYPAATNRNPRSRRTVEVGVWRIPLAKQQAAMGIDWMTLEGLSEAIPPAYTEFIGAQLLAHLKVAA